MQISGTFLTDNYLNLKSTLGNRINRLIFISKHNSSQKINLPSTQNSENDLSIEEKTKTRNIFDKRLSVDEIDEISIEDIEKGVTQALIKHHLKKALYFRRFKIFPFSIIYLDRNESFNFYSRLVMVMEKKFSS